MRAVVQRAEQRASQVLPSALYARAFALAGRAARAASRTPRATSIRRDGELTSVRCTDGAIWTTDPLRVRVYARGLEQRLAVLLARYQLDLRPADTLLDVGANVGEASIAGARVAHQVVAVEPDPIAGEALRRNLSDRGLRDIVTAVDEVLWSTNEPITFYSDPDDANSSVFGEAAGKPITRDAITLDTLCERLGVTPTVLKMDVEGAEPEVLDGAIKTLEGLRLAAIDCGPERYGEPTHGPVMERLRAAGFSVERHSTGTSKNVVTGVRA